WWPGHPRRERLLLVANTVGGVLGLEDRQVAVVERWSGEPLEAGSVRRKTPASDGDAQAGAVSRLGEDLAPVGDVQRNRVRAEPSRRPAEHHVVDSRPCQALLRPCGQEQRL